MSIMDLDRMQLTIDEDTYASALKGLDPEAEASNRRWASFMIADACILLELPRVTCSTAQVLLHRYYCRVPMSGHDRLMIMAMTCLFLATKIEETRRKIRDLLSVFHKLLNSCYGLPDSILDINSNQYIRWRSAMLSSEQLLLSTLGFMVYTSHPHKFLLSFIQRLNGGRELAQISWNFINDFQTTAHCLRYSPETIASASIFFAARMLQQPLPKSPPWYELFGSTKDELLHICTLMTNIYHEKPLVYIPVNEADRILFKEIEEDHRLTIESAAARLEAELMASSVPEPEPPTALQEVPEVSRDRSRSRNRDRRYSRSRSRSANKKHRRSWKRSRSRSRGYDRRRSTSRTRARSHDGSRHDRHDERSSRYDRRHSYGRRR